jgi:hypothetical protein
VLVGTLHLAYEERRRMQSDKHTVIPRVPVHAVTTDRLQELRPAAERPESAVDEARNVLEAAGYGVVERQRAQYFAQLTVGMPKVVCRDVAA